MSQKASNIVQIYKKGEPSSSAFLVEGGFLEVGFLHDIKVRFPADNIVVGTVEYFLEPVLSEKIPRIFNLSIVESGNFRIVPYPLVNEMMTQFKFGANTNIFLARLIEFCNTTLISKSKTPLGPIKRYQRKAASFSRKVDVLFDIGVRQNISSILSLAASKKKLEVYKDGSLYPHYNAIEAITSPGKDKSSFIKFFKKNSLICREGSNAKELFILLDGSVNVTFDNLYVANISKPGEVFGEMSLFLDQKRTASLVADMDSHLYVVPYSQISNFANEKCPELFLRIAQVLSRRFVDTLQRMVKFDNLIIKTQENKGDSEFVANLEHMLEDALDELESDIVKLISTLSEPKDKVKLTTYLNEQFNH